VNHHFKLAIDVGGTFTDVVLYDEQTQRLHLTKTPSSPKDLSQGVIDGIRKVIKQTNIGPEDIAYFVHGTTFATNAFLEHQGSKVALLTTNGFRDVLEIGRQKRAKLYDLLQDGVPSLVERRYRFGVEERMGPRGDIITSLNEKSVREAIEQIKAAGINSIAVVYLHAYANPSHETQTAEWVKQWYPECHVSLSHEISPEFREYERTVTTVMNAYLKPDMGNYLINLVKRLHVERVKKPYIMKSSGGVMTIETAQNKVVETLLSGPAGGVIGASYMARLMGFDNIITLDMGGTSTDVAMILNQQPRITLESNMKGYSLKVPMIEMETIGAGGGSIGWVNDGGLLKVGPRSAGADPGPACYGKGGSQPTITDANLLLGKINPSYFLGGEILLDPEASRRAFQEVATRVGLTTEQAAVGMIQIANHNMFEAVRLVSVRKGFDPKDFTLFAFGGASPLHAAEIAKELGIPRVVVPRASSELSALGFLVADIRHDFSTTRLTPLSIEQTSFIVEKLTDLGEKGENMLVQEGVAQELQKILYKLDLRYKGQAFEIPLDLGSVHFDELDIKQIEQRFHTEHKRQYGHNDPNELVEIVNYRVLAIGVTSDMQFESWPQGEKEPPAGAKQGYRKAYLFSIHGFKDVPVFLLNRLLASNEVYGPAIIEGLDTTIAIDEGQIATIDSIGNVLITLEGENADG
jgi:N-methylhydantoinase A